MRNNLSIYLMKSGKNVITDHTKFQTCISEGENQCIYLRKIEKNRQAQWVNDFFHGLDGSFHKSNLLSSSPSAILKKCIKIHEREVCFCLSFGNGYIYLNKSNIVSDFGTKVCRKIIDVESISQVDVSTFESVNKRKTIQSVRAASFQNFSLNRRVDYLQSVRGRAVSGDIEKISGYLISGKAALNITTDVDIDSVDKLLKNVYTIYTSEEDYALKYESNYSLVKDQTLIAELKDKVLSNLKNDDSSICLVYPKDIDAAKVMSITYFCSKEAKNDLSIGYVKGTLLAEDCFSKTIRFKIEEEDDKSFTLLSCLDGEVMYKGVLYVLHDGEFLKVRQNYKETVESTYNSLIENNFQLNEKGIKDYENEDDYNKKLAAISGNLILDKKFVYVSGDPVELCDVMTASRDLLCVKRTYSGTNIGHLFQQITNAALMLSDKTQRQNVDDRINEVLNGKPSEKYVVSGVDNSNFTFVAVYLNDDKDQKDTRLTFFYKAALITCMEEVERMGFRFAMCTSNVHLK